MSDWLDVRFSSRVTFVSFEAVAERTTAIFDSLLVSFPAFLPAGPLLDGPVEPEFFCIVFCLVVVDDGTLRLAAIEDDANLSFLFGASVVGAVAFLAWVAGFVLKVLLG